MHSCNYGLVGGRALHKELLSVESVHFSFQLLFNDLFH